MVRSRRTVIKTVLREREVLQMHTEYIKRRNNASKKKK